MSGSQNDSTASWDEEDPRTWIVTAVSAALSVIASHLAWWIWYRCVITSLSRSSPAAGGLYEGAALAWEMYGDFSGESADPVKAFVCDIAHAIAIERIADTVEGLSDGEKASRSPKTFNSKESANPAPSPGPSIHSGASSEHRSRGRSERPKFLFDSLANMDEGPQSGLTKDEAREVMVRLGRIMKNETSPVRSWLGWILCDCLEDYRYNVDSLTPKNKRKVVFGMINEDYKLDDSDEDTSCMGELRHMLCCYRCGPCIPSCRDACCCCSCCADGWDSCTSDKGACGCCCTWLPKTYCCRSPAERGRASKTYKLVLARPILESMKPPLGGGGPKVGAIREWTEVSSQALAPSHPRRPDKVWNHGPWRAMEELTQEHRRAL